MRFTLDKKTGSAYIWIAKGKVNTTVAKDCWVDFDADGKVLGIEIFRIDNTPVPSGTRKGDSL